jgi:CDP-diacylglycerol---glycerol-3-phosphate 3-phosphatidyltransferase
MQKVKRSHTADALRLEWWAAVVISAAAAVGGAVLLPVFWKNGEAWRWLMQAGPVLAVVLWKLRSLLPLNFGPADTERFAHLGWGTWITLLRAVLIAGLAGFAGQPWPRPDGGLFWFAWMPGLMYLLAALLDYLDGYVARITRHETRLGDVLDTNIDALGLLVASIVGIGYNQLPMFYIAAGLAYYGLNVAAWIRRKTGRSVARISPRPGARLIAGIQMGFVGAALLPVFSSTALAIAAFIFMLPLLAGFVKDWLIICGCMSNDSDQQTAWDAALTKILPIVLRFAAVWEGSTLFQKELSPSSMGSNALHAIFAMADPGVGSLLHAACLGMLAFGVLGRAAALGLSVSTGLIISRVGLSLPVGAVFVSSLILIMTGTGWASIWQPEESILYRKLGKRK